MLYSGINRSEGGLVERIGLATSADLFVWQKEPANPILEADPRWYELLDLSSWYGLEQPRVAPGLLAGCTTILTAKLSSSSCATS
jgi:hypothetical protein